MVPMINAEGTLSQKTGTFVNLWTAMKSLQFRLTVQRIVLISSLRGQQLIKIRGEISASAVRWPHGNVGEIQDFFHEFDLHFW